MHGINSKKFLEISSIHLSGICTSCNSIINGDAISSVATYQKIKNTIINDPNIRSLISGKCPFCDSIYLSLVWQGGGTKRRKGLFSFVGQAKIDYSNEASHTHLLLELLKDSDVPLNRRENIALQLNNEEVILNLLDMLVYENLSASSEIVNLLKKFTRPTLPILLNWLCHESDIEITKKIVDLMQNFEPMSVIANVTIEIWPEKKMDKEFGFKLLKQMYSEEEFIQTLTNGYGSQSTLEDLIIDTCKESGNIEHLLTIPLKDNKNAHKVIEILGKSENKQATMFLCQLMTANEHLWDIYIALRCIDDLEALPFVIDKYNESISSGGKKLVVDKIKPENINDLIYRLNNSDDELYALSECILSLLGNQYIDVLIQNLERGDLKRDVRNDIIKILGKIGDKKAIPAIRNELGNLDPNEIDSKINAINALVACGDVVNLNSVW